MKRNQLSFIAVIVILMVLIGVRIYYTPFITHTFEWDAEGYYLYLPSHYIYHDMAHLRFWPALLAKYHFPGTLYQASLQPNGKYVFFYEIGLSYLETPFFFIGDYFAGRLGYAQDGFSAPYQYAICVGTLIYVCIALFVLRKILLRYFSDSITTWVLLLVTLVTDFPEYTSYNGGMTHPYLFMLLCFLLLVTIQWHDKPTIFKAALVGFIIGFIATVRITDAVMLFIPILWNTQTKELRQAKWQFIRQHPVHLVAAVVMIGIPIIPQLIYWHYVTGNWVYHMGSKWEFLLPHISVLFGIRNGWFIYTPVAILMVLGLFFLKKSEYKRSIITYFLLNLWIIISWHEYRYGNPYSTRALMQSTAAMSIPLGVFIEKFSKIIWQRVLLIIVSAYLCFLNFFQMWQFNNSILCPDFVNLNYFTAVYLNPSPTPGDMSLIDTDERLKNESDHPLLKTITIDSSFHLNGWKDSTHYIISGKLPGIEGDKTKATWLKLSANVKSDWGAFDTYLITEVTSGDSVLKTVSVRMQNPICSYTNWNNIVYYFKLPQATSNTRLKIYCKTTAQENIEVKNFELTVFGNK